MMANKSTVGFILLILCCWVAWKLSRLARSAQRSQSLPPGPPTLPFIGDYVRLEFMSTRINEPFKVIYIRYRLRRHS